MTDVGTFGDDTTPDSGSVLIIILQCETKASDNNINNLKWAFSDNYFTVQICTVDPPNKIVTSKYMTKEQYLENYYMYKVLSYAAEGPYITNTQGILEPQFWWNKIPVIIVKDSSITYVPPNQTTDSNNKIISSMKHRIKIALESAKTADLFFLCKWNDDCDKYVDIENTNLKWSTKPTATQAIMYTPKSRDSVVNSLTKINVGYSEFLNNNISKGNFLATVFVPNIINYDINLATSNTDYIKANECAPITATQDPTNNTAAIVWVSIFIFLIIVVAIIVLQYSNIQ
jgi:hypothetical protein